MLTIIALMALAFWTITGADCMESFFRAARISGDPFGRVGRYNAYCARLAGTPVKYIPPIWRFSEPWQVAGLVVVGLFCGPAGWLCIVAAAAAKIRSFLYPQSN